MQIAKFKLIGGGEKTFKKNAHHKFYVEFYVRIKVNKIFVFLEILHFEIRLLNFKNFTRIWFFPPEVFQSFNIVGNYLFLQNFEVYFLQFFKILFKILSIFSIFLKVFRISNYY